MTRLDRLEALERTATAGPWSVELKPEFEEARIYACGNLLRAYLDGRLLLNEQTDAVLIVEARNLLPALIEAARALREVHEYQCGCDQPGRLDLCAAQPAIVFEVLRSPLLDEEDAG